MDTQFDVERKVRIHEISGEVNLPEFNELMRQLYASPNFDPSMNALWDYRRADFSRVTNDDVRAFIQLVASYWSKGESPKKYRAAIVVAGMAEYGICRSYESLWGSAAPCRMKVFLDADLAWRWFAASDDVVEGMASRLLPQ